MRTKLRGHGMASIAFAILAMGGALSTPPACATTKVDEGFTTAFVGDADNAKPANRVSSVRQGSDVYYWMEWTDHPSSPVVVRCVIKDSPDGDPIVDHTDVSDDARTEGFTVCGMETDVEDFQPGTFYFAQYIDGELIGERAIRVTERFAHSRTNIYKEFKFWLGLLAAAILGIGWLMRKMGKGGAGPLGAGAAKSAKAHEALLIGARVDEALAPAGGGFERAAKDDATEALHKAALEYRSLAGKAQPAKALESARRYLALLVKDRQLEDAASVFKECIAIDAGFRPQSGEDAFAIAKTARAAGDPPAAVAALRGFDKAFPGHALVPEVYVFSAKLMAEDLGNAQMARKILEHVVQKYPGHFVAQEAKRYLQEMPQPG